MAMKKIVLSESEKAHLEICHQTSNDSRECDRIKAVLLYSEGWKVVKIAQALRLHQTTIILRTPQNLDDKLIKSIISL